MWDSIKSMFGGGDAPPEQLSGPVDPNATQQTFGQAAAPAAAPPTNWGNLIASSAVAGLAGASGDYDWVRRQQAQKLQEELAQNQMAQTKKIQDRQDLLNTVDLVIKGRQIGGKIGEVFTKRGLMGLGLDEEKIKAITKEDDANLEKTFGPAIEKFLRENPEAGKEGFKVFFGRMSDSEQTKFLLSAQQERQDKLDAEGLSQLGQPQQVQQPQPQQPQAPQTQAPANPQAMLNAQIQQSQARLAALTQRRDLIQQATPDKVSPAGKKAALAELDKAISETRAEAGQFIVQAHNAATETATLHGQQQADAHFNQIHNEIAANQARAEADRKAAADAKEAPGLYADKSTGEIRRITQGEKRDAPSNFKPVSSQDATTIDLLKAARPEIDALQELTDKVLAKHPKEHLSKIIQNYSKGKYGADEDVSQLQSQSNKVAFELSRAMSGSSRIPVQLFNAIQGKEVPGLTVTRDVATRLNTAIRQSVENRISSITGQPLQKIETSNVTTSGPKIGDVVKGYRYRGGNPASQDSWVKAAP